MINFFKMKTTTKTTNTVTVKQFPCIARRHLYQASENS